MSFEQTKIIVVGDLYTDITLTGIAEFSQPGKAARAEKFTIYGAGKGCNIARMASTLLGNKNVAMVSKTVKDSNNLWKAPIEALAKVKVNTDFIKILEADQTDKAPGVVVVLVDKAGQNQLYGTRGIINHIVPEDIDNADPLFKAAAQNNGLMALSMVIPLPTVIHAIKKAKQYGLRVVVDPGGFYGEVSAAELLRQSIFLLKPNEHEAKVLTGVSVTNFESAKKAAGYLLGQGVQNVLITHGEHGAYMFTQGDQQYIAPPQIKKVGALNATGCGDQTTAALCAYLAQGASLSAAAKIAVIAGTVQFHKAGVEPVTKPELEALKA